MKQTYETCKPLKVLTEFYVSKLTLCATKAWPDKVNNQQTFNYFRGREKLNNDDDLYTIKTFSGAARKPPRF